MNTIHLIIYESYLNSMITKASEKIKDVGVCMTMLIFQCVIEYSSSPEENSAALRRSPSKVEFVVAIVLVGGEGPCWSALFSGCLVAAFAWDEK